MAKKYATDYNKKPLSGGHATMGYSESYSYSAGGANGDEIYFGIIPAGVEINNVALIFDADADASIAIGYETLAGAKTQAGFVAAQALTGGGRVEGRFHPIVFTEDVRLVGTITAGTLDNAVKLSVITDGKGIGV